MRDSRDFKEEYAVFLKKVPYQTAVVDGVTVRYQYGGKDGGPVILFFNGLEMQEMWMPYADPPFSPEAGSRENGNEAVAKKEHGILACESEEDRSYGSGFYEAVASDLHYKQRFIHSFKCVYMLKDYPLFKESDFEYLRGKIQVLLPEKDLFKKEDQDRLVALFQKLDAEILHVPGGHVGFIVQAERYMDRMETFLKKSGI